MSNGTVQPFAFPATGQRVRTITVDGEPWFVAADVCAVLDLGNPRTSLALLDEDEKGVHAVDTPGGPQQMTVVNEAGLYSLILRSRKPEAKAFKRWITHDVLPAIRRTGTFSVAQLGRRELAQMVIEEADRADRAEARAAELEPDAARAHRTLDAEGLALVGTVAKRFGITERALREFLFAEQLLIRDGSRRNEPYARHIAAGYFDLKARVVYPNPDGPPQERSTTYVTPKGEALIWRRLYNAGYVRSPQPPSRQLELI